MKTLETTGLLVLASMFAIAAFNINDQTIAVLLLLGIIFVPPAIAGVMIAKDAKSRGMNGSAWGWGVFLVLIVFLPLYLIVRGPRLADAHSAMQVGRASFCSSCGFRLPQQGNFCPGCAANINEVV